MRMSFVSLSATLLFVSVSLSTLTGCPAEPPPAWPPPPPPIELDERAAPIAVSRDASSLKRVCEQERERLREVIDLAERREIHEGGPHLLKEAKAEARTLDSIQARIEAAQGGVSEDELDEIHVELRRFSARLTLLADNLR